MRGEPQGFAPRSSSPDTDHISVDGQVIRDRSHTRRQGAILLRLRPRGTANAALT